MGGGGGRGFLRQEGELGSFLFFSCFLFFCLFFLFMIFLCVCVCVVVFLFFCFCFFLLYRKVIAVIPLIETDRTGNRTI